MTIAEKWKQWVRDNPDAEYHQVCYALGVVDGFMCAQGEEEFKPLWPELLAELNRIREGK